MVKFFRFVFISIILFTISFCGIHKTNEVIQEQDIEIISQEEPIYEGDWENFQNILSNTLQQYTVFNPNKLVIIVLTINEKGKIIDFQIKNTISKKTEKSIKKELSKILPQFKFIPGKIDGKPIKSRLTVPISLK